MMAFCKFSGGLGARVYIVYSCIATYIYPRYTMQCVDLCILVHTCVDLHVHTCVHPCIYSCVSLCSTVDTCILHCICSLILQYTGKAVQAVI